VLNLNLQKVYYLNYLIVIVLDHRNYLVDEDQLAKLHWKQMLMKDHMNQRNEDLHNFDFAIEQDLMVTMVDYLFVIVVDLIENDSVLVDLFVDYKMDNVVAEQQVQLIDIVIVVVNVVVVDIEIDFDLILAYYNVLMIVVASYYYFVDYFPRF
jgi:hypothetical protein